MIVKEPAIGGLRCEMQVRNSKYGVTADDIDVSLPMLGFRWSTSFGEVRSVMKKLIVILVSVMLPIASLCMISSTQAGDPEIKLVSREVSMGKIHPGIIEESLVMSPDGERVAYIARRDRGLFVVVEGMECEQYYELEVGSLCFSPNSKRLAYAVGRCVVPVAHLSRVRQRTVYVEEYVGPSGKSLAYGGRNSDKGFVVVDGVKGNEYDWIVSDPIFSPDSKRIAYVAKNDDREFVVVDGLEENKYGRIMPDTLTFSPNSERLAYVAGDGKLSVGAVGISVSITGRWFAVANGVEGKEYGGIIPNTLTFSPDSKRLAYVAGDGLSYSTIGRYASAAFPNVLTPLGLAYNGELFAVVDGVEGKRYSISKSNPVFSPDSKRVVYAIGDRLVVMDEVGEKEYGEDIEGLLCFSPDGKRLAYQARVEKDREFVMVDEVKGTEYAGIVSEIVFSSDSKRMAYWAAQSDADRRWGSYFVVADGVEGNSYGGALGSPVFSPDSKHVAYTASSGEICFIVVDGIEGENCSGFVGTGKLPELIFDSPTVLHTMALRGNELYRVEVEIMEH